MHLQAYGCRLEMLQLGYRKGDRQNDCRGSGYLLGGQSGSEKVTLGCVFSLFSSQEMTPMWRIEAYGVA